MHVAVVDPDVVEVPVRDRSRWLTASSGLLLFACMFMPLFEYCGEASYPAQAVATLPPHLLGALAALAAMVGAPVTMRTWRAARGGATAMVVMWSLVVAWFAVFACSGAGLGGAALGFTASLWLLIAAMLRRRDLHPQAFIPGARVGGSPRRGCSTRQLVTAMAVSMVAAGFALPWHPRPRPAPPPPSTGEGIPLFAWGGC